MTVVPPSGTVPLAAWKENTSGVPAPGSDAVNVQVPAVWVKPLPEMKPGSTRGHANDAAALEQDRGLRQVERESTDLPEVVLGFHGAGVLKRPRCHDRHSVADAATKLAKSPERLCTMRVGTGRNLRGRIHAAGVKGNATREGDRTSDRRSAHGTDCQRQCNHRNAPFNQLFHIVIFFRFVC